jgi:hydroxymethylpyrimidine pyrophosphatase-like HAD family hydrolase
MRYLALCCDYDGTLAHHGVVDAATVAALEKVVDSGRRLVLVTGRELEDLQRVLPRLDLFERVVAENGALLYTPATGEERPLAAPPSTKLVQELQRRNVAPLSIGHAIIATWEPHDATVLEAIRDLGLELQVIFNKGAVMVLPSGVNKATGLRAALDSMNLSPHNAIGVGDAENDHALLALCECAVAVRNALPALKQAADIVTTADHGAGVAELIEELLRDDLASRAGRLARHRITLGSDAANRTLSLEPYATSVLVAGTSGSGKSTAATGIVERIAERGYSFCIVDPEGEYDALTDAVALGAPERAPSVDEAVQLLEKRENAVFNLVGMRLADRPGFFLALLPRLLALRAKSGNPHWLVIDEAHHLLPAANEAAQHALPERLRGVVLISVHPDLIAPRALAGVSVAIAVGKEPVTNLRQFARATKRQLELPAAEPELAPGEALVWSEDQMPVPARVRILPSRGEHRRHIRKYAEGELGPDRSFWFRGPANKLNLRAQNLIVFMQIADGIDEETWNFHRERGDYSRWFAERIKDETLAAEARRIEAAPNLSQAESRAELRKAIERIYTLPA